MAVAIPHNALLHDDNSHLYCQVCRDPLHQEPIQDVITKSIEEIRNQLNTGSQFWAAARGEENFQGEGSLTRIRRKEIDPVHVKALEQVREGLSNYPIQGGVNLRADDGTHMMEHIWRNQTGSIPASRAHSSRAIGKFIKDNDIKGHTTKDTHGMSNMDKMWGPSEDLPTWGCNMGSKLRESDQDTVCDGCYVDNVMHLKSDSVQAHQTRNLLGLANPQMYAAALSWQIGEAGHDRIRLNASGDMQSPHHFAIHSDVARAHPDKKFWLSTREHEHLREFIQAGGQIPPNLTIRVSQHKQHAPVHHSEQMKRLMASHPNITGSSVNASHRYDHGAVWACPAAGKTGEQNRCETHNCDACWDPNVKAIDYTGHGSKTFHHSLDEEEKNKAMMHQWWVQQQLEENRLSLMSPLEGEPDLSAFLP